ncbi:MAG: FkbM family methyltransferase [Paracoccaceae bacterium]|jgi:FkbM family methyltransferase
MGAHVTVKYTQRFGPGSGWAESLYHTVYLRRLEASSVIVDLGASLGFFSREMNELFGCRCHAVEALPENYALIEESSSVTSHHLAICGTNGPVTIHSVAEGFASASIDLMPGQNSRDTIQVDGITLGGLMLRLNLDRVALLKVDIEGAELAMFYAADDATLQRMDQITVEFHDFMDPGQTVEVKKIIARLRGLGFWSIKFTRRFHGDVLFLNPQRTGISRIEYLYARYVMRFTRGIRRMIGEKFAK